MSLLLLGVLGGVTRANARFDGVDLKEEWPDLTDSGMLDRADTLPAGQGNWGEKCSHIHILYLIPHVTLLRWR